MHKKIDEGYSTQECCVCHARTGPKGLEGLNVREWTCGVCHTTHQRDVNAATNIKTRGIEWLAKECSVVVTPRDAVAINKTGVQHSLGSDYGPLAEGILPI